MAALLIVPASRPRFNGSAGLMPDAALSGHAISGLVDLQLSFDNLRNPRELLLGAVIGETEHPGPRKNLLPSTLRANLPLLEDLHAILEFRSSPGPQRTASCYFMTIDHDEMSRRRRTFSATLTTSTTVRRLVCPSRSDSNCRLK